MENKRNYWFQNGGKISTSRKTTAPFILKALGEAFIPVLVIRGASGMTNTDFSSRDF